MSERLPTRSNEDWLRALESDDGESRRAMQELERYLRKILRKVLRDRRDLSDADLHDLTQESLLRLVEFKHTFRGDSRFTTWATTVATRVAFTALRKRAVRERGRSDFETARADAVAPAERDDTIVDEVLQALRSAIEAELTERQRIAILAELRGVPTIEIAEQMDTNQNALYKLVHDARKRLRGALLARGYSSEVIRDFTAGAAGA